MDAEKKLIKSAKARFPKGSEFIDLSSYIPKGEERKAIATGKFHVQYGNVFTYHDNYHYLGAMCYSDKDKKWSKKTLDDPPISNPTPKGLKKVIGFLKSEKIRIAKFLKKEKTENCESAFLFGEQKQVDYILDWLQKIENPKLLDE